MHTDHNPEARADRSCDTLYGRRIEMDRSWTVYNVFKGISADAGHGAMKGLNYADATHKMLFLNHSSPVQRAEHAFPRAHPHRQRS